MRSMRMMPPGDSVSSFVKLLTKCCGVFGLQEQASQHHRVIRIRCNILDLIASRSSIPLSFPDRKRRRS